MSELKTKINEDGTIILYPDQNETYYDYKDAIQEFGYEAKGEDTKGNTIYLKDGIKYKFIEGSDHNGKIDHITIADESLANDLYIKDIQNELNELKEEWMDKEITLYEMDGCILALLEKNEYEKYQEFKDEGIFELQDNELKKVINDGTYSYFGDFNVQFTKIKDSQDEEIGNTRVKVLSIE